MPEQDSIRNALMLDFKSARTANIWVATMPGKQHGKLEGAPAVHLISTWHDFFGWAAALLTLLAFSCDNIVRLRYVAITANVAFIAYGFSAELWPVFVLHVVLVPVNVWRLRKALRPSPRHMPEAPVGGLVSVSVKADTHA